MADLGPMKKMLEEMLAKKKEQQLQEAAARESKVYEERNQILDGIGKDLGGVMQPFIDKLSENSKISADELKRIISESVQVTVPGIDTTNLEKIIAAGMANIKIPAPVVHIPPTKIPAPVVNVPAPVVNFPSAMRLQPNDKPFPVMMVDQAGKPMQFPIATGGGGGRGDFFTIKDIQTSTGASIISDSENAIRITGSVTTSGSVSSTLSQMVNRDGNFYDTSMGFPVNVVAGSTAGAVGQGDAASATRVVVAGNSDASVVVNSGTLTAVTSITNSIAAAIVDSSGVAYSGSNPVPVVFGASATQAVNMVDSGGVAYSGSNPVPTNNVQWNSTTPATGLNETNNGVVRTVLMTDSVASVVVNSGTITAVTSITNSIAAAIVDSGGVEYSGSNPVPTNNTQWNGAAPATGLNETNTGVVRTVLMTDSVASVVVNSGTITAVTNITNSIAAAIVDSSGVEYSGSNPIPISTVAGGPDSMFVTMARTTNPTAVSDGADVRQMADKLGRQVMRPVHVRDLILTARASITNGTETTLLTAAAGTFLDCISVMCANSSSNAVSVDFRSVSTGNIDFTVTVPANSTAGIVHSPPWPQGNTGNAWTADMGDDTQSMVINALFSKEI